MSSSRCWLCAASWSNARGGGDDQRELMCLRMPAYVVRALEAVELRRLVIGVQRQRHCLIDELRRPESVFGQHHAVTVRASRRLVFTRTTLASSATVTTVCEWPRGRGQDGARAVPAGVRGRGLCCCRLGLQAGAFAAQCRGRYAAPRRAGAARAIVKSAA